MSHSLYSPVNYDNSGNSKVSKTRILRGLAILLLAVGVTTYSVDTSLKKGRLSNVPNYDDVTYFVSATDLLQSTKEDGFKGLMNFLHRDGLHSPYSTGLASLAYLMGGYNDVAPYAANGILIVVYLCCVSYFFRDCNTVYFCLALWTFVMLPFANLAVVEFRPDPAWAVVTGFAVVFAITRENFFENWRVPAAFGALVGISLLIKPSTFAMTIVAATSAFGSRWIVEFARTDRTRAMRVLAPSFFLAGGSAILVAAPYFAFHWRDTWNYFYENSFGKNAAVWANPGDRWDQWLFYLSGGGAASNLGSHCWIILAIIFGLAVWNFKQSSVVGRLQTAFLGIVLVMVYYINSTAAAKTPFLGGAFYGILIFSAAYFAGKVLSGASNSSTVFVFNFRVYDMPGGKISSRLLAQSPRLNLKPCYLLLIIPIVMTGYHRWPACSTWPKSERNLCFVRANAEAKKYFSTISTPKSILFTQAGPVVFENIQIYYLRRGERPSMNSGAFLRSVDEFKEAIKKTDVVIAQDRETLGGASFVPSEPLQDEFLSTLGADTTFQLEKTIPISEGRNVYIFARKKK